MNIVKRIFARTARVDSTEGVLHIDSIPFPYCLAEEPTVEPLDGSTPLQVLTLRVLVDGAVIVVNDQSRMIFDPIEGEVGEWAKRIVREGFAEIPWLKMEDL